MRAEANHGPAQPHADGDPAHPHGTRQGYLIGFAASAALTAVPFWLVMADVVHSPTLAAIILLGLAAVQIVVHMVFFLHMNTRSEGGWTFISLVFTATLVVVALAGSLWVMRHMDHNMMPMTPHQARTQP